jgi:hypothetical protein
MYPEILGLLLLLQVLAGKCHLNICTPALHLCSSCCDLHIHSDVRVAEEQKELNNGAPVADAVNMQEKAIVLREEGDEENERFSHQITIERMCIE